MTVNRPHPPTRGDDAVRVGLGALPHVATAPLSELSCPGASPQDQATVVLMWQATRGIFEYAPLVTGLLILPLGL